MPLSNTVLRRYTPPTCTLEVWAENSPLSRWKKKSVLRQLSFELRFDDPRLAEGQRVKIQGDHHQLEALRTIVSKYVQELLQKTPENFWKGHFPPQDTAEDTNPDQLKTSVNSRIPNSGFNTGFSQKVGADIFLQPTTQLNHKLFLGSLASPTSGSFICLSQLQLFDLASALEEYSAEAIPLPSASNSKQNFPIQTWIPAAAVVVAAVGLAPFTWQYANRIRQQYGVATQESSPESDTVATQPNLQSNKLETQPSPLPTSSSSNILGNQPLVSPTALPNIPTNPTSSVQSANPSNIQVQASPQATFPSAGSNSRLAPIIGNSTQQSSSQITATTKPPLSSEGILNVPGGSVSNLPQSSPVKTNSGSSQINIQPNNKNNAANSGFSDTGIDRKNSNIPTITNSPPKLPNISTSSRINPSSIESNSKTSALIRKLGQKNSAAGNSANSSKTTSSSKVNTGGRTLFDTNQVAQVRQYLKKRWRPPAGLKQRLEYSVTLGVDGSIERILPLGGAARQYFNSTGMPPIGEPFVAPSKNGQDTRIRAIFSPNGRVQAFPETD